MSAGEFSLVESVIGVENDIPAYWGIKHGYENLMGQNFTDDEFESRVQEIERAAISGVCPEDRIVFLALENMFTTHSGLAHANTLTDWTTYDRMFKEHGQKTGGRALMVGSISPLSSRAFEVLAQDVYGADDAFVVDLRGSKEKALHGHFVQADGLELPFKTDSMNYVHTNVLLHMLENPHSPQASPNESLKALIDEVFRVLSPDGQLLMVERGPGTDVRLMPEHRALKDWRFALSMRRKLKAAGFEHVVAEPSMTPGDAEFLFDRNRDFSPNKVRYVRAISDIVFYAHKKAA